MCFFSFLVNFLDDYHERKLNRKFVMPLQVKRPSSVLKESPSIEEDEVNVRPITAGQIDAIINKSQRLQQVSVPVDMSCLP